MDEAFFARVEQRLLDVESRVGLIGRFHPLNFAAELTAAAPFGQRPPSFVYDRPPDLSAECRLLETVVRQLETWGAAPVAQLLIERVNELELEIRLVDARGTADLAALAARRFPYDATERSLARSLAEAWLADGPLPDTLPTEAVVSLASALSAHAGVKALGCSVVEADIVSVAAVSGDRLLVRRGARVTEREVERIFVHEVGAHLVPRLAARGAGPPFRIGTAGCAEDEEGRAIVLEARHDCLDGKRRRELAARFLASEHALVGATAGDIAIELGSRGLSADLVRSVGLRALRGGGPQGGGLGREIVYLASYIRVRSALEEMPELESWMTRGRIAIAGARILDAAGHNTKSTTTGV